MRFLLSFSFCLVLFPDYVVAQPFWSPPSDSFEAAIDDIHTSESGSVFAGLFLGGIYRSTDGAESWQEVSDLDVEEFAESEGVLYAAGLNGLLHSTDDGLTWDILMPSGTWSVAVDENTIVAGGTGGQLYRSEDRGSTWSVANCALMPEGFDDSVYPVTARAGLILYRHSFGSLFASNDGGLTWEEDPSRSPSLLINREGAVYSNDGGNLVQSTDGLAWNFFSETPFFSIADISFADENVAVASFSGVAISNNDGESWRDMSEGLVGDGSAEAIAIASDRHAYVAAGYQVQRSSAPIDEIETSAAKRPPQAESHLLTPYPNPFDRRLRIPFVLASTEQVEIAIFDEIGRRIDVLLSRRLPAGKYDIDWTPKKAASGTYFVRMDVGGHTRSTSITLSR